ncbi:MAG: sigma-70 family RNA polymerase sigma factor [Chloroflexi bacterium]|nr:sigma-70 family RNA polymerase sigma factor [Chloroflexota bacterium]
MNEEQTWVFQAQKGDDQAFTQLVETYQKPVYNLCYRMLGDPNAAEDAAQETFLRAFQHLGRYDAQRSFATWLLSIAAHYCIDRLRRRKFSTFSIDEEDDDSPAFEIPDADAPNPERESVRREEKEKLHAILKSLDATDRAAIVMRYWHDSSEAEIAEALGLTVSAVKSRLHRARLALGKRWEESTMKQELQRRPHESPAF